jgi:signal peptidase I
MTTTQARLIFSTSDDTRYCGCIGASMTPTLSREDIVEVEPCAQARVGDVLLFKSGDKLVIHRVVAAKPEGLMTRGDHNNHIDDSLLAPREIVGRVVAAYRGSQKRRIHGGRGGQLFSLKMRILQSLYRVMYRALAPGYHRAVDWGINRWIAPLWKPTVVSYRQEELRLLCGGRVVGWYHPVWGWKIRPLFRLLVDESRLPGQTAGETRRYPEKSASCGGLSSQ